MALSGVVGWQGRQGEAHKLGALSRSGRGPSRRLAVEARKTINDGHELTSVTQARLTQERERLSSPRLDDTIALFVKLNRRAGALLAGSRCAVEVGGPHSQPWALMHR